MNPNELPVMVAVDRNGRVEHVRVGTAVRQGEGFVLRLGELMIGGAPVAASRPASSMVPSSMAAGDPSGVVFPNYGRRKGESISGAPLSDLEYYANGCRRTLDDPSKSRWHQKEQSLLAAIEGEIARQQGGGGGAPAAPSYGGGSNYSAPAASSSRPSWDEPPPAGDEDIPF